MTQPVECVCVDCGRNCITYGYIADRERCVTCRWIVHNVAPSDRPYVRSRLGVPLIAHPADGGGDGSAGHQC